MLPLMDEEPEEQDSTLAPIEEVSEALEQPGPDALPIKLPPLPVPKRTKPFDYTIIARRNDSP
jgi:hypothetical protein